MAEATLSDCVNVSARMMDLRSASISKLNDKSKTVWMDYQRQRVQRAKPEKMTEVAESEVRLIEDALFPLSPQNTTPSVVVRDDKRLAILVDDKAVGRVVNRSWIWTPLGLSRYSAEHRTLAEMVISS